MKFIKGIDRNQAALFPISLEQSIDEDNDVRIIDLFVDSLSLQDYGFKKEYVETGRPAYHPADLLKLYMYGYLNKTRTSRDLEKECKRNIEMMWLLKGLQPDHNTIANFRKDNPKAIKKVFRATVQIAKHFDLIGGKLIAGDSTKYRAQNSKKNNFNQKKIDRHVAYIDNKLDEYNQQLVEADEDKKQQIQKEIEKQNQRKDKYNQLEKQLKESGEAQISTSDDLGIDVMIAIPTVAAQAPNPEYNVENFTYYEDGDYYVCPQANKLTTNGRWHKDKTFYFKRYTTKACKSCPVKDQCSKAKYGKAIQRSEYQEYIDKNKDRIEQNPDYYRQRQAIVEHPYGTIKRQWGFSYILTKKGKKRASSDVGLMFTAYNIRRLINIVGKNELKKYLEVLVLLVLAIYRQKWARLSYFNRCIFYKKFFTHYFKVPLNRLIFV